MLNNKVVIVTGAIGLLGTAIVKDIQLKGGIVINLDINNSPKPEQDIFNLDVTREESIASVISTVMEKYQRIDGLVNNAYPRTKDWGNKFEDVLSKSFSRNLEIQLSSIFTISKPVLNIMKNQGAGSIVHIASVYGIVGNDFTVYENTPLTSPVAYSAIKGGLINMSRYMASYFGKYNVRSNCVSPGGIFDGQHPTFVKQYSNKVPMKRMGDPDDIAPAVSFLLSDQSSYITGQNIAVDGGWTAI